MSNRNRKRTNAQLSALAEDDPEFDLAIVNFPPSSRPQPTLGRNPS